MSQDTGEIREKMVVVSSDGEAIGTVDRVDGDRIRLATGGPHPPGEAPYVSVDKVELVEADAVHLLTSAKAAIAGAGHA